LQGASQHTPSTQFPLEHCEAPVQGAPLSPSAWQVWSLERQNAFATHWPSPLQVLPQLVPLAHRYGLHETAELMQVPESLHTEPVTVPLAHVVAAQGHPAAAGAQAPPPLQVSPVVQLNATDEHSLSGSVPAATVPQVPSEPPPFLAALHAWHLPVQDVLQHTPSTQKLTLMGHTVPPQQFTEAATHELPQQMDGDKQQWTPSHLGSSSWQMACESSPRGPSSSDGWPGAPEAQPYSRWAKISAHNTASLSKRERELGNAVTSLEDTPGACVFCKQLITTPRMFVMVE